MSSLKELNGIDVEEKRRLRSGIDADHDEQGGGDCSFSGYAYLAQSLKDVLREEDDWPYIPNCQREAVEMICQKLAHIVNGDVDNINLWMDIACYAQLVARQMSGDDV